MSRWLFVVIAILRMNTSFANTIHEKLRVTRILGTGTSSSPPTGSPESTPAPSPSPSQMPSRKTGAPASSPVPGLTTASSSSSASLVEPQTTMPVDDGKKTSGLRDWSVVIPVAAVTMLAWAAKGNAFLRQRATACCTGDYCFNDEASVPCEIVIRNSRSEACSVVGDNDTDIELQPMSSQRDAGGPGVPRGNFYRKPTWNSFPIDPVDEVSLKGPSFDCSSVDEDGCKEPKTSYVRI